ncbi:putative 3-methyladenine DNA glycosylase isoform X3 [Nomia melanderi]|uniref:putative 3-methyladenine DNA glycosylase isoform X3 n=1 Tax=Nomia melanderi TaxID=2448451 RepID=UPI00130423DA|nr:uncharacterized protein LOC116429062 isoform X3 [Nomia melanderi]
MKRTRSNSKTKSKKEECKSDSIKNQIEINPEGDEYLIQAKNLQNQMLNNTLKPEDKSINNMKPFSEPTLEDIVNPELKKKRITGRNEELKPNTVPPKNKPRAVVDLKLMKEELKQLEDPPSTDWEKEVCANRLPFSFFDSPCEELAQNLLGKILVRCLENGTILKGRIVETESYLGAIDKASHTYQNKVTPRNIPMYMPPGTIYVYFTYGMYHCFNISSQESSAYVQIKAVEPILGLDYMELLRNMQFENNRKEKKIKKIVSCIKQYELCNSPFKICAAFDINEDNLNEKQIYKSKELWIENDPYIKFTTIVAAHPSIDTKYGVQKARRYYVLGSSSVTRKDVKSEEHAYNIC